MVMSRILGMFGYESSLASNGREAVEILKKERFDLVLMDQQMPILDGTSATKEIRVRETGVLDPEIPIVAVTASAMPGDRERFLAAGMNDYLPKPVIPADLSALLERWLGADASMEENSNTKPEDLRASHDVKK
jgi:CheY-like chemotaxis protein